MSGGRIRPGSIRPKQGHAFNDGLINALSGMGTTTDARSYNRYFARIMSPYEVAEAYRASWVMRKAIDKPAVEMVREWRDWQADSDDIEKLEAEERRIDLRNKVKRAEILRGLGGAGMVLYVNGDQQDQPLDPKRIRAGGLAAAHVWHRTCFSLGEMIADWSSPWFGQPSYYEMQIGGQAVRFHPSRVVAFRAEESGDIMSANWVESFWGQSRVQSILDAVQNVDTADTGFATLIKDARNRRISIPGLLDMVSTAEGEARLQKRLQAFALGESSNAVSWLDGGDGEGKGAERIEDRQMSWAGMPDIMSSYRMAAAAAADMPATVLWGQSPQGMNATGTSDIELWHKTIKGKQDLDLRPCMAQIDAALIPSALGKPDDTIWYDWAPLSTQSEKDEATTFFTFMQGVEKLQATGAIPDIAFEKALQNALEERGWLAGLGDALSEIPDDERFPSLTPPDETDPSAIEKGGDPKSQAPGGRDGSTATRRAVNDAEPRTLYVQRKLLNADDVIAWAKAQGFETTLPAADMHVTIAYSRAALDWMKVDSDDWNQEKDGTIAVPPGGVRLVERLGDGGQAVVLMFGSSRLAWRHEQIVNAGASWDWPEYQPHITITWAAPADLDVSKIEPYRGELLFGPEIWQEVNEDWRSGASEV